MKIIRAADGVIVAGSTPAVRRDKVNAELCADPEKLAETLTRMSQITNELAAKEQTQQSIVFQDYAAQPMGAVIRLNHGLNRRVMWRVVDWGDFVDPPSTVFVAPALVKDQTLTTANELVLRSYSAGLVSIEVF